MKSRDLCETPTRLLRVHQESNKRGGESSLFLKKMSFFRNGFLLFRERNQGTVSTGRAWQGRTGSEDGNRVPIPRSGRSDLLALMVLDARAGTCRDSTQSPPGRRLRRRHCHRSARNPSPGNLRSDVASEPGVIRMRTRALPIQSNPPSASFEPVRLKVSLDGGCCCSDSTRRWLSECLPKQSRRHRCPARR